MKVKGLVAELLLREAILAHRNPTGPSNDGTYRYKHQV